MSNFKIESPQAQSLVETFNRLSFPEFQAIQQANDTWYVTTVIASYFMNEEQHPHENLDKGKPAIGKGITQDDALLHFAMQLIQASANGEVLVTKGVIQDFIHRDHYQTYKFDGTDLKRGKYVYIQDSKFPSPDID